MKRLLLLVAVLAVSATLHAQDVIIFRNGDEQQVRVLEISDSEVRYKTWSNQEGPTRTKSTADIFLIKYSDGTKETFADKTPAQQSTATVSRNATPTVAPKIVSAERDHRMEVGIRVRPILNIMFLSPYSLDYESATGMRFFGALGGTFDWYITKNSRNPWLVHTALEYSFEGGNFENYNGQIYRNNYINFDLGYGLRSRIVNWNFGFRAGILTNSTCVYEDKRNKKNYSNWNPAVVSVFTNFGFCVGKHVDFGVSYAVSLTPLHKRYEGWLDKEGAGTTNFQCGWYVTYRFHINKRQKTEK